MAKEITEERETLEILAPFIALLVAIFVFPTYIMPVLGEKVAFFVFTLFAFIMAYFFFRPLFRDL